VRRNSCFTRVQIVASFAFRFPVVGLVDARCPVEPLVDIRFPVVGLVDALVYLSSSVSSFREKYFLYSTDFPCPTLFIEGNCPRSYGCVIESRRVRVRVVG
jgi:hypothetical protein